MTDRPDASTWREWGIDPTWSRELVVDGHDGRAHRWHVLDTGASPQTRATLVCVHGNPTWAYAWKSFLVGLPPEFRVVAIDQLGMGYSERGPLRRYATRVADLGDLIDALDLGDDEPLFVAAHDWGGAVAMGWAVDHRDRLSGLVLCNTGIAVPDGRSAPGIIRLAASPPLRDLVCRRTPGFVEGTVRLSGGRITATDRAAFRAPYRGADRRAAIADFVGDIPLSLPHPTAAALDSVAEKLPLVEAPVLLAWGAADPVFDDDFADDLASRFPDVVRHRFAGANHLVMAEADVASVARTFLLDVLDGRPPTGRVAPDVETSRPGDQLWSAIAEADPHGVAVVDASSGSSMTFGDLDRRVEAMAAELRRRGLRPGERVAMLTPPGVDLIAAVYAVWRGGGVTVVADRGLGLRGLRSALRSASPDWVIGPRAARWASLVLRWAPGATSVDVAELVESTASPLRSDDVPAPDDMAAVLFTSGATGPAKGVAYRHRQLCAQRDALATTYDIASSDRLVAAFAPFALYGPALGIATALPDCDVTEPGTLDHATLRAACEQVSATLVFASPSAWRNVVDTAPDDAGRTLDGVRLALSAGAPVPPETLRAVSTIVPSARIHTPYGMTEILPVADIALDGIDAAERDEDVRGVCVGAPVEGAEVRIVELDIDASAGVPEPLDTGDTGEILARAAWCSDGYPDLWATERSARPGDGWHRTGDVGHLDRHGRLWVEGRALHVLRTLEGVLTSVDLERRIERAGIAGVVPGRVAVVGVGPAPIQQVVVVVGANPAIDDTPTELAPDGLTDSVREALDVQVAAVLVMDELPVDIRHNAKIDRVRVAQWADGILAGGPAARP